MRQLPFSILLAFTFILLSCSFTNAKQFKNKSSIEKESTKIITAINKNEEEINKEYKEGRFEDALSTFSDTVKKNKMDTVLMLSKCPEKFESFCSEQSTKVDSKIDSIFNEYFANEENFPEQPNNGEELIVAFIKDFLIDPDSANFKNIIYKKSYNIPLIGNIDLDSVLGWEISGEVNSKNRFGGYVGFQPFNCFIIKNNVQYCEVNGTYYHPTDN